MTFNIALFGAGRIGTVHARNIAEHSESRLKFVVDPATASAEALAARLGATVATEDEVWASPKVDAIVIGTATASHAELIEKGLKSGKAVFCEKPIDLSMKRVEEVMSVVKASASPLFLAFNRRFDPGILEMKRRIVAGEIGALELVTVISKDPAGGLPIEYLKTSGGMFRDMTIHDFDMARHIMGEEFVSIQATAGSLTDPAIKEIGDIDTATVSMQTASGRIAVIINSRRASYGYDQRVEAHGALGMLRTQNVPQHQLVRERAEGVQRAMSQFFFVERYAQSYANEWSHFVRVLKGEEAPSPSGEDGHKALGLAEAAYRSLETQQRVAIAA